MSTSTTNPPPSNPQQELREKVFHNFALGLVLVCPLLIALPPRKLDFYTFTLVLGTGFGANQLLEERYGYGIFGRVQSIGMLNDLPNDRAREMQTKLRQAKEERERQAILEKIRREQGSEKSVSAAAKDLKWETEAAAEARRIQEENKRGVLDRLWMGNEKPDWKKERDRKEKEALEEGKGYGDLIMDQIWEVWNWGQDKAEKIKAEDEKVVEAKKEEKGKK